MKRLLLYICVLLAIASCTKDETTTFASSDGTVQLSAWVATRVSDSDDCKWASTDEVGVFTNQSGEANLLFAISNASTGEMSNDSGTELKTLDSGTRSYYAYHPYNALQSTTTIAVDCTTSQSTPLLWATATNNSTNVALQFAHKLVKVTFDISVSGVYLSNLDGATTKLTGAYATADFDITTGKFSNNVVGDIALTLNATTGEITAYLPPMAGVAGNVKLWITASGKTFAKSITTQDWTAGSAYNYDITIGSGVSRLSFSNKSGSDNISKNDDSGAITTLLSKFRRCLMTVKNGEATICYLNNDNSNLYNSGESADLTGAEGDVMVYMPEYWYKYEYAGGGNFRYYISESSIAGGVHVEESLVGAYKATLSNSVVRSISGATPSSLSKSAFEASLTSGCQLIDYEQHCAIAMMLYAKYCDRDLQIHLGAGAAGTSSQTGSTNSMGNSDTTDATDASYVNGLGIEGVFGGLYEWVSGVSVASHVWTITNPDGTTRRVQAGASSGYISSMALAGYSATNGTAGYSSSTTQYFDMVPMENNGTNGNYYADYYTQGSGDTEYCLVRSGYMTSTYCGVACTHVAHTDTYDDAGWGSRIAFRGTITEAASATDYKNILNN